MIPVMKLAHFNAAGFLIAVTLCVGSLGFAQAEKPTVKVQVPVSTEKNRDSTKDGRTELERLNLVKAKLLREHMDASGHVRPDLRSAGIAQIKRMKTATHIGPIPNEPPAQIK
jgi:hypothetical protein